MGAIAETVARDGGIHFELQWLAPDGGLEEYGSCSGVVRWLVLRGDGGMGYVLDLKPSRAHAHKIEAIRRDGNRWLLALGKAARMRFILRPVTGQKRAQLAACHAQYPAWVSPEMERFARQLGAARRRTEIQHLPRRPFFASRRAEGDTFETMEEIGVWVADPDLDRLQLTTLAEPAGDSCGTRAYESWRTANNLSALEGLEDLIDRANLYREMAAAPFKVVGRSLEEISARLIRRLQRRRDRKPERQPEDVWNLWVNSTASTVDDDLEDAELLLASHDLGEHAHGYFARLLADHSEFHRGCRDCRRP